MKRLWKWSDDFDLEAELRAQRAEPRREFLDSLVQLVRRERPRSRYGSVRLAFGTGLTALMLIAFAAVGGISYAASAVEEAVSDVTEVVDDGPTTETHNPSDDQYRPGKGCGDKNHIHEREHQCKITVKDVRAKEGNSDTTSFVFTLSLNDLAIDPVTVVYATAGGTATPIVDFVPVAGTTATFAVGSMTQTVTVEVVGETAKEPDETFFLNLFDPSPNAIIEDDQGLGTIVNDD
jgi:hypothetical protein